MAEIRLIKRSKSVKIVNRHDSIRLQHTGKVGPQGPQGPIGPQGPQGPTGDAATDVNFEQAFNTASIVTVNHNLGKKPAATVIDSSGDECEGSIAHISNNQLIVSFSAPFSGIVICN